MEMNLIMLNVLINAFATAGRPEEALSIYHHMIESVSSSVVMFLNMSHKQCFPDNCVFLCKGY